PRSQLEQAVNVAPGYPTVRDVAHQADRQPLHPSFHPADGEDVKQSLSRMFVSAVAGIDNAASDMLGQQVRRPGDRMAHHHEVHALGFDVLGGVDERLAFTDAGGAGREVDGVGRETLGGQAKAGAGPSGGFKEEVDDNLALQIAALLAAALADL